MEKEKSQNNKNVDTTETTHTILSYCTGMRGLERGLERAGVRMRVAAFLEIEAFICANLVSAMEKGFLDPAPIWTNIKTFDPEPFRGKIHGIIGGYPCQPFSLAGQLKGEDDPRHLWPFIASHIRTIRPLWCFFENVANHLNIGYETVRGELQEMGYHVEEGIYAAQEVGAPHRRERLFILAISKGAEQQFSGITWKRRTRSSDSGFMDDSESITGRISETEQWNDNGNTRMASEEKLGNTRYTEPSGWKHSQERQQPSVRRDARSQPSSPSGDEGIGTMADTDSSRSGEDRQPSQLRTSSVEQSSCNSRRADTRESEERSQRDRWPARPGEEQYQWEHPRIVSREVESSVGIATHGYNFREDLLRMAGNGVVEQQAEYAFRDLIRKHAEAMKK